MEISFYNCAKKILKLQIIAIMQKKFAMKSFTRSNLTRAFNQMEKEFEDKPKRKLIEEVLNITFWDGFWNILRILNYFRDSCLYFNLIFEV